MNWDLKCLLYPLKIYSKYKNIDIFRVRFCKICAAMESVICCNEYKLTKLSLKSEFYLSTSILPLVWSEKQSNQM